MNRSLISPLLALLCLALSLVLAYQWITPSGQPKVQAWVPPAPIAPELPSLTHQAGTRLPEAADIQAINDRPLFSPLRRPPAVVAAEAPPPPDPLDQTQISGILDGDIRIIMATVQGQARRLRLQDKVGDWTLQAIEARQAVFARAGQERKLTLAYTPLRGTVANPQPAAAANPATAGTPNNPSAAQNPATGGVDNAAAVQELVRERQRRRNEVRARAGLPPLPTPANR